MYRFRPHQTRLSRSRYGRLGKSFRAKPGTGTYLVFRTTARTMQTAAESNKEVLAKK